MGYEEILFSTREATGFLTLNNPRKANALSGRMISEISDALARAAEDATLKVLVIRAAGKHFCAGHDLAEMLGRGVGDYKRIFDRCEKMMQMIRAAPQVVIAQVQGIATAAGCQLVAWCDLAVAEEGARFATPGVKIGFFCTTPMVALTRAVGRKAAMEMLMTGRYVDAAEAKGLGLVNRVVPPADLAAEVEALAVHIGQASRWVLSMGKQGFYSQVDQPDEKALQYGTRTMAMGLCSEDAQAGIGVFLGKPKRRADDL